MKKTLAMALFLALGAGTIGVRANLDLKGSDTLKGVTTQILAACPAAVGLRYLGGGSGAGETAIFAGSQDVAPMSRFVQGAAPSAGACGVADKTKVGGVEIAGDDIGIWVDHGHQAACDPGSATDTCNGYTNGCMSFTRTIPDATVDADASCPSMTVTSYKDVLRLIYFGLRPTDFTGGALPAAPADPSNDLSPAAVAARDCRDCARNWLANHYGFLFQNNCAAGADPTSPACTRLQHAFRRDEDSGTTDFFRETLNLEAGSQIGNRGFPYCNEYVPRVTINMASVPLATPNPCNPGCTTSADCGGGTGTCDTTIGSATFGTCTAGTLNNACPAGYQCIPKGGANRCVKANYGNGCTVATSATDCPAGSACDPGQNMCATTCTVGAAGDAACNGVLAGATCVGGFCARSVDACTSDADCADGNLCDAASNACSPKCVVGDAINGDTKCGNFEPTATCKDPRANGQTFCQRTFGQICPVPGLVVGQSGGVAGTAGVFRGPGTPRGYYMENQMDVDPIRRVAIGNYNLSAVTLGAEPACGPAEQVASGCADLGLVLPISEPPSLLLPADADTYMPVTPCAFGFFKAAAAPAVTSNGTGRVLCPNGDMPIGAVWDPVAKLANGGLGQCLYPTTVSGSFACINGKNNSPTRNNSPPGVVLPAADGRAYNLHVLNATNGQHLTQSYAYNGPQVTPAFAAPSAVPGPTGAPSFSANTEVFINENEVGAYFRIHATRTTKTGTDSCCTTAVTGFAANTCCRQLTDTNQIGCLVEASPCSMGYAGKGAGDITLATNGPQGTPPETNFSVGLNTTAAGACVSAQGPNGCIPNGPAPLIKYNIARDLFVNTANGFGALVGGSANQTAELGLVQCMTAPAAKPIYAAAGFVNLNEYPCCKDFDQDATCGSTTAAGTCFGGDCTADAQCGTGGTCTGNVCVAGTCSTDNQCGTANGLCSADSCSGNAAAGLATRDCAF